MDSPDWDTRTKSIDSVLKLQDPRGIDKLMDLLKQDMDFCVRIYIFKSLLDMSDIPTGIFINSNMDMRERYSPSSHATAFNKLLSAADTIPEELFVPVLIHGTKIEQLKAAEIFLEKNRAVAIQVIFELLDKVDSQNKMTLLRSLLRTDDADVVELVNSYLADRDFDNWHSLSLIGRVLGPGNRIAYLTFLFPKMDRNGQRAIARELEKLLIDANDQALLLILQCNDQWLQEEAWKILKELDWTVYIKDVVLGFDKSNSDFRRTLISYLDKIKDVQLLSPYRDTFISCADDADSYVCSTCGKILARLKSPGVIDSLLKQLSDEDFWVRSNAAESLGELGNPQAVIPLIRSLNDENTRVRAAAASALGDLGDKKAVEPLIELLNDPDVNIRNRAANSLGTLNDYRAVAPVASAVASGHISDKEARHIFENITDVRAIDALFEVVKTGKKWMRVGACEALAKMNDPRTIDALIYALNDNNNMVRRYAVQGLSQYDDPRAHEALLKAKNDSDREIQRIANNKLRTMIGKTNDALVQALKHPDSDIRKSAVDILGDQYKNTGKSPDTLIAMLHDKDIEIRKKTINVLMYIRDRSVTESLIGLLKDDDPGVKKTSIEALGKLDDERAFDPLNKCLYDSDDETCFLTALSLANLKGQGMDTILIGGLDQTFFKEYAQQYPDRVPACKKKHLVPDYRAIEILIDKLGSRNTDTKTGYAAVFEPSLQARMALIQLEDPRSINPLINLLQDKDPEMRKQASFLLGVMAFPQSVEPLRRVIKDISSPGRADAALALKFAHDDRTIAVLTSLLDDTNSQVQAAAAETLGVIGSDLVIDQLLVLINDDNVFVRRKAVEALGSFNDDRVIFPLLSAIEDSDPQVRKLAATSLGNLKISQSVIPLMELLRDADPPVRASAAAALGKICDTIAVTELLTMLDDPAAEVRMATIKALGRLGDSEAVKPLMDRIWFNPQKATNVIQRSWVERKEIIAALGEIGDPRAVEKLISVLKNRDDAVSRTAEESLKSITGVNFGNNHEEWMEWWQSNKQLFITNK